MPLHVVRKWCKICGGHVFYGEKMLGIKDGLPKMKDFPAEFGGSGATLPE